MFKPPPPNPPPRGRSNLAPRLDYLRADVSLFGQLLEYHKKQFNKLSFMHFSFRIFFYGEI